MNDITIMELVYMLIGVRNRAHNSSMDILKSLYEKEYTMCIARFTAMVTLLSAVIGTVATAVAESNDTSLLILVITIGAFGFILAALYACYLFIRIQNVQRQYLYYSNIYNLLSRYF